MKKESIERNFGQYLVIVRKSPCTDSFRISISGNLNANFGLLYTHNFERFKNNNNVQVIGMEWEYGLTNSIKKWIYKNINNDRFLRELGNND